MIDFDLFYFPSPGKRSRLASSTEDVQRDLDALNSSYADLVTVVSDRIKALKAQLEKSGKKVQVRPVYILAVKFLIIY